MSTTTRAEHLSWCKKRALQYCDMGDINQAFASFMSDMRKDDSTKDHIALPLMVQMRFGGMLSTPAEMRRFIEGFN